MARQTQQHACSLKKSVPCPPVELCITSNITLSPPLYFSLRLCGLYYSGVLTFSVPSDKHKKTNKKWFCLRIFKHMICLSCFADFLLMHDECPKDFCS